MQPKQKWFYLGFVMPVDGSLLLDQYVVWNVIIFVECSKETQQLVQQSKFGIKLSTHVLIGLNYNGFYFLKPENRALIIKIDYSLVSDIKSFPIELTCKINNCNMIFKTQTPYEIKHLILEYQELIKILSS